MGKVQVSEFRFNQLEKQKNKTVQEIIEWFKKRKGLIMHEEDIYYKGFDWVIETLKKGYELETPPIYENQLLINVNNMLIEQTKKGYVKYGKTVQAADLTTEQWIQHAQEEIIDTLVYLECLKERLKNES